MPEGGFLIFISGVSEVHPCSTLPTTDGFFSLPLWAHDFIYLGIYLRGVDRMHGFLERELYGVDLI
jgi:hypothetical protein